MIGNFLYLYICFITYLICSRRFWTRVSFQHIVKKFKEKKSSSGSTLNHIDMVATDMKKMMKKGRLCQENQGDVCKADVQEMD